MSNVLEYFNVPQMSHKKQFHIYVLKKLKMD